MRLVALFLLLLMIATGCKSSPMADPHLNEGVRTNLTKADALKIAEQEAIRSGRLLSKYKRPSVEYDKDDDTWFIFYQGKRPMPGNHFSVSVQDDSGEAKLWPGA